VKQKINLRSVHYFSLVDDKRPNICQRDNSLTNWEIIIKFSEASRYGKKAHKSLKTSVFCYAASKVLSTSVVSHVSSCRCMDETAPVNVFSLNDNDFLPPGCEFVSSPPKCHVVHKTSSSF